MRETITFNIQNTTNGTIPVSILGNNADPMDNANATTQYAWNLGTFNITSQNTILIQYKNPTDSFYTLASVPLQGNQTQDIANALNTLNIGSFFITTSGVNKILNCYNQNVAFNYLNIFNATNDAIVHYVFDFTGAGLQAEILKNAVSQVLQTSPSNIKGQFVQLAGDSIKYDVTLAGNTIPVNYFVFDMSTNTYLLNVTTTSGLNNSFTFATSGTNSYLIGMFT